MGSLGLLLAPPAAVAALGAGGGNPPSPPTSLGQLHSGLAICNEAAAGSQRPGCLQLKWPEILLGSFWA